MSTYTIKLRAAIKARKDALRYVAANTIQDVLEAAQTPQRSSERSGGTFIEGKIPVDTAELINSLATRINGSSTTKSALSYTVAISGFQVGDTLEFAWTSPYANRIERGFTGTDSLGRKYNVKGRRFVGKNVERTSEFANKYVREVSK